MFLVCGPKPPFHATNTTNSLNANLGHYAAMLSDKSSGFFAGEISFVSCAICKLSHLEA